MCRTITACPTSLDTSSHFKVHVHLQPPLSLDYQDAQNYFTKNIMLKGDAAWLLHSCMHMKPAFKPGATMIHVLASPPFSLMPLPHPVHVHLVLVGQTNNGMSEMPQ